MVVESLGIITSFQGLRISLDSIAGCGGVRGSSVYQGDTLRQRSKNYRKKKRKALNTSSAISC